MGQNSEDKPLTRDDVMDAVLAALVVGDRTVQQVAARLKWSEPEVAGMQFFNLEQYLDALVGRDWAFMRWPFDVPGAHYVPTKKGREHAAQVALKAAAGRLSGAAGMTTVVCG